VSPQPAEGRDCLSNTWGLATASGVMTSLVVLGANPLGDGLRDLLDPRLGLRAATGPGRPFEI